MPLRILIADDNEAVRRGAAMLVASEQGWEVCGEASNGYEAIENVRILHPDLVLVDMRMAGRNGLEIVREVHNEFPHIKNIIMSQNDASVIARAASETGAVACIDKSRLALDLVAVVKRVTS